MAMMLSEIAGAVDGELQGKDIKVSSFSINTRTLDEADLYIAIKGQNFDGHSFVAKAEEAGASAILVEQTCDVGLAQIVVKNSHLALAELAGEWKKRAEIKAIAITGSNGKTTVKEMVAAILEVNANVLFTQGNLNNDIGVPLTLLKLQKKHQYAVIEIGANHSGEIAYSSHYVQADVAVITNVGAAHIEGFGSLEGIAKAKGEIISSLGKDGVAVLNKDDDFFSLWEGLVEDREIISFGLNTQADVRAKDIKPSIEKGKFASRFVLSTGEGDVSINLGLAGQHNVVNALAAATSCLAVGVGLAQIKIGLEQVQAVGGRLQPLLGTKGGLVINDTYNANPSSVKAALEVLIKCKGEPWFVMGALAEIGTDSVEKHRELGVLIKAMNISCLLTVGADAEHTAQSFGKGAIFFKTQTELISYLDERLQGNETVLVKGSRSQKMETVVEAIVTDFRT